MKNKFMFKPRLKSLAGIVLAMFLGIFSTHQVQAQCDDDNALFFSTSVTCGIGLQTLTSCIYGGEYLLVNVTAGNTYTFETCGDSDFDTQITLYDDFGGGPYGYNDDFCGLQSQVTWVATFTGDLRVLIDQYFCIPGTNGICMTLQASCTASGPPPPPTPCTNTSQYGSATINPNGAMVTISTCSYAGEYSVVNGAVAGQTLQFTSSVGTDIITVRSGSYNGPVLANGTTPLVFANTYTGTVYAHWNTTGCGSQSSCRTTTVQCTNCPLPTGTTTLQLDVRPHRLLCSAAAARRRPPDGPALDCGGGSTAPDVWYTIVGNGTPITASLCGSSYDTQIDLYTGACGALSNIGGCNDDFCGLQSQMTWTSTAGVVYLIRVHGFGGSTGNFTLAVTCLATPPPCLALPTSPTNGQTGICPSTTTALSWPTSLGATSYDVYFGTTTPPPFLGNTTATSFSSLTPAAATYFWQIRPVGPGGTASGCAVWSFTKVTGAFTVPANGASTVACPSQIVQPPAPPAVTTNCGTVVTPTGPTITNSPNPITCEGTRTFTWTYNNGFGQITTWDHVITVERQPFGVPANGGSTVACPDQTDAQPVPPVVMSNCGEALTPVITSTAKPGCEGNRNWNFTYTDCEGNTATWTYIYTVEYLDFVVPASETETVECPLNAIEPTPPVVHDNCGNLLNAIGPVIASTNNANGCEDTRRYSWTYTDCEGTTKTWSKLYNIQYTADFFTYPNTEDYVSCLLYAQPPVPPTFYDNCGIEIEVTGPTVSESVDGTGCSGVRTFTYVYTNCGGFSKTWSHTYYANDNEPPIGNCVNGSANSVDVTNIACIEDVPCPADYDFSEKIEELLEAGNIYDVCSGDDLNVVLHSWSVLWQCNDDDGDGVSTFGRTFYFSILDQCGNEMPELCAVTYSGVCQPLEFFLQGDWGNEGGEPSASTVDSNDIQTINDLLAQGPLMVGGSLRSLTLTSAECVQSLLPGIGNPTILSNCQQMNCNGCNPAGPIGMKNILATNTVALMLNMRFSVLHHGLTMTNVRNQGLGCIEIDPNIKYCVEGGPCKLRIFDSFGNAIEYPYTLGGLLDLSNLYLNGGIPLTGYTSPLYAAAIHKSITNVNTYWHNGQTPTTCSQLAASPLNNDAGTKALPTGKPKLSSSEVFSLAPNPAGSEVTFKLAEMVESQEVTFEIYNQLGQLVLRQDFGKTSYVNERIDLSSIGSGLYIVSVKAGGQHYEQKLVIGKG
ncbi:MAG: T9SS type A sorting domain-containing protein [Saprospiraceae bacterium]|nr:T9SS type A sorting domain-containing protein [Saprospiraceae bacterium]